MNSDELEVKEFNDEEEVNFNDEEKVKFDDEEEGKNKDVEEAKEVNIFEKIKDFILSFDENDKETMAIFDQEKYKVPKAI